MNKKFREDERKEEREERYGKQTAEVDEGDEEEADGEEEEYEGDEEMDEEGMDEDGDEEMDEEELGDEEGMDEEDLGGEEEEGEGNEEGEMDEEGMDYPTKVMNQRKMDEDEVNSSFWDSSSELPEIDPTNTFLPKQAIYDPSRVKRRMSRLEIKDQKAANREEFKELKLGTKIKARGHLTNNLKRKNNPYQMFIQKRRLQNRMIDLKKELKKKKKNKQQGHSRVKMGRAFNRK
jgi:hypothetical protein